MVDRGDHGVVLSGSAEPIQTGKGLGDGTDDILNLQMAGRLIVNMGAVAAGAAALPSARSARKLGGRCNGQPQAIFIVLLIGFSGKLLSQKSLLQSITLGQHTVLENVSVGNYDVAPILPRVEL